MTDAGRIHVVGAGLAGLSAAVSMADLGRQVIVSEAAKQAGGRCRSYHDSQLDMVIDNGNHLVLSGNVAVSRYLRAIGAQDRLAGPSSAEFSFFDCADGRRWTLKPNEGRVPWWVMMSSRRVPGSRLGDYLALAKLTSRHPGRRIDEVIRCDGLFWDKFLQPVLVSALNTAPAEATANLAGAVMRETLAKGGRHSRPLLATPNLAAAFVDPALEHLRQRGAAVRLGRSLRALKLENDRLVGLVFDDGEETLAPNDRAILAIPPWAIQRVLPGVIVPDDFRAIVNAHFKITAPANAPSMLGLIGGTVDWIFAFPDRVSITISAADHLLEIDNDALAATLWGDVARAYGLSAAMPLHRIVKEKRATFASTPAQERKRPPARTRWTNLFLAGDWTDTGLPATIEGALRSGETAATLGLQG